MLVLVDQRVVAREQLRHPQPLALFLKQGALVQIGGQELLDIDHVHPIGDAGGVAARKSDNERSQAGGEIVGAADEQDIARVSGDVDGRVPRREIARPPLRLIGLRHRVVLHHTHAEDEIEFRADEMLERPGGGTIPAPGFRFREKRPPSRTPRAVI